jgi:hypothetical protein
MARAGYRLNLEKYLLCEILLFLQRVKVMKKLYFIIFVSFFTLNQSWAVDTEALTQKSQDAIKTLGGELKATLQASIKAKGPIESISVCNIEASKISQRISDEKGLMVARTSVKYRNFANKPDAWEESVLQQFEQRKIKGEALNSMVYSEVTEYQDKKVFRYMKAIPTDDICLTCHGRNVAEPLAKKILSIYPDDKATGFNKGDIRGAFTVIQPLE